MTSAGQYDYMKDQREKIVSDILSQLTPDAMADPNMPETVQRLVDQQLAALMPTNGAAPPADGGLSDLMGLSPSATTDTDQTVLSPGVIDYDDTVSPPRLLAAGDLYYQYVHDRMGVFDVVLKLQELFRAGTLRISHGSGAFGLYRFDKHAILRYRKRERFEAYRRVFGYGPTPPSRDARPNPEFHGLFTHFVAEAAKFWRDKRISEVIRERATDPTFGSVAIVRRAALDLRNNVKNSSYGYVNVMRIENSQALDEAFAILSSDDVRAQFGAETPWDTVELVMWQYFHRAVAASALNRMAVTGRAMLQWLAEPYVLTNDRRVFEANLYQIAEQAEEWISSEEGMRLSRPTPPARNVYLQGAPPSGGSRRDPVFARISGPMPAPPVVG
jgi:hypothetical protein